MRRIIIVCEGATEQEFCKDVLSPYFLKSDICILHPSIKASGGGIVHWSVLRYQLENHLKHDRKAIVSTFIDYYGIKDSYCFPGWEESKKIGDKGMRMMFLENAMKDGIDAALSGRFVPYLQLHEFESLLFSSSQVFRNNFGVNEVDFKNLDGIIARYPNPEDINDGPTTAPSKRLMKCIPRYSKVVFGACLAAEIGLDVIRGCCPKFSKWITLLERGI